jgi:hypothetical protein
MKEDEITFIINYSIEESSYGGTFLFFQRVSFGNFPPTKRGIYI